ncbi:MAG: diaminopimelate epimerase [Bacteroidota bacterium]
MKIHFTKMSGAGNDFVVIDNRSGLIKKGSSIAQQLCDRRSGIGADGLILLEQSKRADYKMVYYNADGSSGGMCGNGGRCIAFFSLEKRIAPNKHFFEALDFVYYAEVKKSHVTLRMKDPADLTTNIVLPIWGKKTKMHYLDTGSPHSVVFVKSTLRKRSVLEKIPVEQIGKQIRNHIFFQPKGTNVNFVEILNSKRIKMRTFERGVETETPACGTGAIASAIAACLVSGLKAPITVETKSNMELEVNFTKIKNSVRKVTLMGPVRILFKGEIIT